MTLSKITLTEANRRLAIERARKLRRQNAEAAGQLLHRDQVVREGAAFAIAIAA